MLLLEAGGTDVVDAVPHPGLSPTNIRSKRDWGYTAEANPAVLNRKMMLPTGKVVGGGSSINVMAWVRPQARTAGAGRPKSFSERKSGGREPLTSALG